ncbi:MAG: sporulation protein YabP [Clostridia bacterium]|nr:sporulation protein YabP [Clostridia bacterium]
MELEKLEKNQMLTLENRSRFTVGLVENVENFSEEEITLKTALGGLNICGNGLKMEDLSIENGNIILTGRVNKIEFVDIKEKHSFFRDLFR